MNENNLYKDVKFTLKLFVLLSNPYVSQTRRNLTSEEEWYMVECTIKPYRDIFQANENFFFFLIKITALL